MVVFRAGRVTPPPLVMSHVYRRGNDGSAIPPSAFRNSRMASQRPHRATFVSLDPGDHEPGSTQLPQSFVNHLLSIPRRLPGLPASRDLPPRRHYDSYNHMNRDMNKRFYNIIIVTSSSVSFLIYIIMSNGLKNHVVYLMKYSKLALSFVG